MSVKLRLEGGEMEETGVRKYHAVTARTASFIGRDVIGRCCGLGYKQRLKAILLSCTVGVVSLIAGCAGAPGPSHDNAAATTQRTGPAASQTVDECLAWDIACRREQPVWLVAGPGDRGHEGGAGGPSDSGPSGSGPSGSGPSDSGPGGSGPGGPSDSGPSNSGPGDSGPSGSGPDDGGRDNKGLGNGDENDGSSDNGSGNTDDDNPGKGGGGNGGNGHGGS